MNTEHKIWRRLFINIAIIFLLFAICVSVANSTMFESYYTRYEKDQLRMCAKAAYAIDLSNQEQAENKLSDMESNYNADISIYYDNIPIYSTLRRANGGHSLNISGFDLLVNKGTVGIVLESYEDKSDNGTYKVIQTDYGTTYFAYYYAGSPNDSRTVTVMIEQSIIKNSAEVASQFVLLIISLCLALSLLWCIVFSKKFSRPIEQMNDTARKMAQLDFSQKVSVDSDDEIGLLAESLNELSESLDAALRELNERNKKLENEIEAERRLDSMRKDFVASVSHELKTPLSIIQGYAEGLCGGMAEDEQTRAKYCRVITDEVKKMHSLVINLLELSRFESGVDREDTTIDLTSLLINIADKNNSAMQKKNVDFSMDVGEREVINADPVLAEHVIQNYLSNAISHVPQGGKIRIYTEPYKNVRRVCVYNSGSHIEDNQMENIWQSFYRGDGSHNRAEGRFGLGLSIVKAIMLSLSRDFGVFNTDDGVVFWAQLDVGAQTGV